MRSAFVAPLVIRTARFTTTTLTRPTTTPLFSTFSRPSARFRRRYSIAMSTPAANSDTDKLAHGYQYDLFVIGAGSGGVRASRIAAKHGAKVAVAERGPLGGTCVNVGCVPKKLFVYGSHYSHDFHDAESYGWDVKEEPKLDWARMIRNKNEEIHRLNGIYGKMLDKAGVKLVVGEATFVDSHTIRVGEETYTADKILLAVGGRPFVPDVEGKEHVITSNEAFYLSELPKRVVITGGGYIATEFACIFHGFGSHVVQLYRREKFMRGFDDDIRDQLAEQMRKSGIDLRFNTEITKVQKLDNGCFKVSTDQDEEIETDLVMYATGRVPLTDTLQLDKAGVELGKKGKVVVDEYSRTSVEHIYAVGDCTDRVALTPVAIAEGHAFADTVFGGKKRSVNYENIPTAVFANPTLGTCGLTEAEARDKYGTHGVDIFKTSFRPMKHTMTKRNGEQVFMKLVVERETDKVVGCHMLDSAAADMIQLIGVAMKAGATKADFDSTMPVHPVSAEEIVTLKTKEPDP